MSVTRSDCAYLVPLYGWQDEYLDQAADKMMADRPTKLLGVTCGWAGAHPEIVAPMPDWLEREAHAAPGYRDKHCAGCRCYAPPIVRPA